MGRKEISEQIGALNIKIFSANKELEEMELAVKKKRIEIRKYRNEIKGLQLKIEEIEIEQWREKKEQKEKAKRQVRIEKKLKEYNSNDYYSQENKLHNTENSYIDYMSKNVLPYND